MNQQTMDPEEFIINAFSKRNTGDNMFMPENHEYEEIIHDPDLEKNGYDEESNDDPLMNIGEDPSFFQDDIDGEEVFFPEKKKKKTLKTQNPRCSQKKKKL
jgi:hypothetical protein